MNAVIVDIKGHRAAALSEDGCVRKIPNAAYELGQQIELFEEKPLPFRASLRRVSGLAAAAVLVLGLGAGTAYALPYGVVSLDVNPAVEYTINCFDYVLSAEGVNEDGKSLLETMDRSQLLHRKIDTAVSATMEQLENANYLNEEKNSVLISAGTKNDNHSERLLIRLEEESRESGFEFYGEQVSLEEIEIAHEAGLTAGRQQMIERLGETRGEDFSPEDWADRPVEEIAEAFGRPGEKAPEGHTEQMAAPAPDGVFPEGEIPGQNTQAEPPALPEHQPGEGMTPPSGDSLPAEPEEVQAAADGTFEAPREPAAPAVSEGFSGPPAGPGGDFQPGNGPHAPGGGKT